MHDNFSSLSGRAIVLRVLPAIVAILMLLFGPKEAPRQEATASKASAPKSTR